MLTQLNIRNFAIIEDISITFTEGLTVLTGETGAGKSIIIDAIELLAGERGSVEFVRHETNKAEIEGLFIIDEKHHPIYSVASAYGMDIQEGQIVLQRTITSRGKSICRVNGKLVTLAVLREFGKTLIDIHSQHETQSLMDPDNHIELLDMYDESRILPVKKEYLGLFEKLDKLKKRYKKLNENEQEMAQRLDLLRFQFNELEQAELQPDEDLILEEERNRLANFQRIYNGLQDAYNALYGEQKGMDFLNEAQLALQENQEYDEFIAEKADILTNQYYLLEETTFAIRDYLESLEYDPYRLNEIEARLDEINRLKRKYGSSVNEMLDYMGEIAEEIEEIDNKDSHLLKLEREIEDLEKDARIEAEELHVVRQQAANALTKEVESELKGLYLEKARFSIAFREQQNLHVNGKDTVIFMISTNPGEPLKDLTKVASGGELSRIMLVLKKIFAKHQGVTSVIFDEVDTGVSGRVAQAIAEKIYQISLDSQVLCITHLPQVASMADTHKLIQKKEVDNRTATNVQELTETEQIDEIGRMITGSQLTDTATSHAREMIGLAKSYKSSIGKSKISSR
ncbi:DNA repair protein RecN [Virgibacillus sp. 179-BFC.A HS]|uniref:DNA repair protein RecN n=1 Tax=Tigheibacillus jepli TaxID=3035914 RepID=A0ABU5CH20_9BACI|nr:DNA repair protein RecN [Virgibacillus sp. 179-BFC.A HS]MDY0405621.1 DNA repair protein RecN [Virgibacillus sp. 179-BFC.A HS]